MGGRPISKAGEDHSLELAFLAWLVGNGDAVTRGGGPALARVTLRLRPWEGPVSKGESAVAELLLLSRAGDDPY